MHKVMLSVVLGAIVLSGGCRFDPLTGEEAREALEESSVASQAAALVGADEGRPCYGEAFVRLGDRGAA